MNILFKALNDATRREILELLKDKDRTAGEIADHFQLSKPSISHHLDILKRADLISSEKNICSSCFENCRSNYQMAKRHGGLYVHPD